MWRVVLVTLIAVASLVGALSLVSRAGAQAESTPQVEARSSVESRGTPTRWYTQEYGIVPTAEDVQDPGVVCNVPLTTSLGGPADGWYGWVPYPQTVICTATHDVTWMYEESQSYGVTFSVHISLQTHLWPAWISWQGIEMPTPASIGIFQGAGVQPEIRVTPSGISATWRIDTFLDSIETIIRGQLPLTLTINGGVVEEGQIVGISSSDNPIPWGAHMGQFTVGGITATEEVTGVIWPFYLTGTVENRIADLRIVSPLTQTWDWTELSHGGEEVFLTSGIALHRQLSARSGGWIIGRNNWGSSAKAQVLYEGRYQFGGWIYIPAVLADRTFGVMEACLLRGQTHAHVGPEMMCELYGGQKIRSQADMYIWQDDTWLALPGFGNPASDPIYPVIGGAIVKCHMGTWAGGPCLIIAD